MLKIRDGKLTLNNVELKQLIEEFINRRVVIRIRVIPEKNTCIVCGHSLSAHLDEGDGWRCHAFGADGKQCECFLRKDKANGDIYYYSYERRVEEALNELGGTD